MSSVNENAPPLTSRCSLVIKVLFQVLPLCFNQIFLQGLPVTSHPPATMACHLPTLSPSLSSGARAVTVLHDDSGMRVTGRLGGGGWW